MCFAPQRRALFRHLNFQKWSETGVFCAFWLRKVLRARTACTFSTSQLPKVVRTWCALHILISKCASRHNGVHFFILSSGQMALHPLLERAYFKTLRSHKSLGKHSVSRLFYLFAHLDLLSSAYTLLSSTLFLLSKTLTLSISAFHLSILSEVWLLNFLAPYIYIVYIYNNNKL